MSMFAKTKDPIPTTEEVNKSPGPSQGAVVPVDGGALPAALMEEMEKDAGRGVSTDQADNLVPLIYVLQAQSPQVLKKNENYIEGAEAGDIWLRNADQPIVKGEEGEIFQPCHFAHGLWIEWGAQRGSGFVARHSSKPAEAELGMITDDRGNARQAWVMPSGNVVVETRQVTGLVHGPNGQRLPYVIPFSGTGHTVAKGWNSDIVNHPLAPGKQSAAFHHLYRLKTRYRTNKLGEWYLLDPQRQGWVQTAEDVANGRTLCAAVESGEKQAAPEADTGAAGSAPDMPF
jgi:hypothetical protein